MIFLPNCSARNASLPLAIYLKQAQQRVNQESLTTKTWDLKLTIVVKCNADKRIAVMAMPNEVFDAFTAMRATSARTQANLEQHSRLHPSVFSGHQLHEVEPESLR